MAPSTHLRTAVRRRRRRLLRTAAWGVASWAALATPANAGLPAASALAPIQEESQPALAERSQPPRQLVTVLHAHTSATTGGMSVAQIARAAREVGVDALLLTENFGYRFRYAPALLRSFFEATRSTPMLEDHGIDSYLAEIRRVQQMNPEPLLLIGIETPPYYYWSGSLLRGDLVLHDMQRNVLVLPPPQPTAPQSGSSYAEEPTREFFERLPTVGNRYHRRFGFGTVLLLVPGILAITAGARALIRGGALRRSSYVAGYVLDPAKGRYVRRQAMPIGLRQLPALALLGFGATLLFVNFPYAVSTLDPYDAGRGYRPVAALIDEVRSRDGLLFWSMPEATDRHEFERAGIRVRLETEPYAEGLIDTDGYTGFGAVYADNVTVTDVGGLWDRALLEYARGERASPGWAVGESAFHFTGQAGKQLDDILTIVLVGEPSHRAVFDALAAGRMYATRRRADRADLRLTEFAASAAGVSTGASPARSGDTLEVSGGEFELALRIDEAGERSVPIAITIVRDGEPYRSIETVAPFEAAWLETLEGDETTSYYRVMIDGPIPARIVSNPIFVHDPSRGGR